MENSDFSQQLFVDMNFLAFLLPFSVFQGVVIKYNEPSEARKPKTKWRLYPFKGDKSLRE